MSYIIVIIILIIIFVVIKHYHDNMTYILSDIDNQSYLVNDTEDKQYVANLLAQLKKRIDILNNHLYNNIKTYPDYEEYIKQLHDKLDDCVITENSSDNEYTSYSVNKGEQLVFCVHSKKHPYDIHDINLMMYVVLHELSHVACPYYDNHGPLFKKIFSFLTIEAMKLNLYTKIDFSNNYQEYCGITITNSII